MTNVVIRVDASDHIGSGHLMRCITLAQKLSRSEVSVLFISRAHERNLSRLARESGYKVVELASKKAGVWDVADEDPEHARWLGADWVSDARDTMHAIERTVGVADWLVVDHYGIDHRWESRLRARAKRVLVIDDLADRAHDCDLLVDQTYGRLEYEYERLVPPHCGRLIGPGYALLRPEFRDWREVSRRRERPLRRGRLHVLVSLGGTDVGNLTAQVLRVLDDYRRVESLAVTVIMGQGAPHLDAVRELSEQLGLHTEIRAGVSNMAELMAQADIAIGAAGSTSWERCCLGVPTLILVIADNQRTIAATLESAGVAVIIDPPDDKRSLYAALDQALDNPAFLKVMSKNSAAIVDGEGADRLVEAMRHIGGVDLEQMSEHIAQMSDFVQDESCVESDQEIRIRPMVWGDVERVFQWQSKAGARRHSRNPEPPTWAEHLGWWEERWSEEEAVQRIVETAGMPIGILRLDPIKESKEWEVSILIDSSVKGRGYGKTALMCLCREFWDRDLVAEVAEANHASQRLFESVGFERVDATMFRRCARTHPHGGRSEGSACE